MPYKKKERLLKICNIYEHGIHIKEINRIDKKGLTTLRRAVERSGTALLSVRKKNMGFN